MDKKIWWLMLGGALGTLARYCLAGYVYRWSGSGFPWGTVVVNVTGCVVAGTLWGVFEERWVVSPELRTAVMVGFLGAFTTFSTMIVETNELLRLGQWWAAVGNLLLQNGLGWLAFWTALTVARQL
ncbi:MAG: putative fluoride ion transporter CrcB [Pirellulaceae bacterium]|nr:MAG: putative fluoride ion transporter CrcB [Pirellulaceae bacterium]